MDEEKIHLTFPSRQLAHAIFYTRISSIGSFLFTRLTSGTKKRSVSLCDFRIHKLEFRETLGNDSKLWEEYRNTSRNQLHPSLPDSKGS
jgi:hypothetical protein